MTTNLLHLALNVTADRPRRRPLGRATLAALATTLLTGSAIAAPPSWEDVPVGTTGTVGGTLVSDGVVGQFDCFEWSSGTLFCGGSARIDPAIPGCNSGHRMSLNNITVVLDYAGSIGPVVDPVFGFGEYGGNINLAINGDFRTFNDMLDIDGTVIGGCLVQVLAGGAGNDCGLVRFLGPVDRLRVGGQEFWWDGAEEQTPPCDNAFLDHNDLPFPMTWPVGSTFATAGVDVEILPLLGPGGPLFGFAASSPAGLACGDALELNTNNVNARYRFASTIGILTNPEVLVGDQGGFINLAVNGSAVQLANDWIDFDGAVMGGCTVKVVFGGHQNECTRLRFEGTVARLTLGGQEHAVDCMWAEAITIPGDLNGDGCVDSADLGILLGAWGTPGGDINGDGTTDAADMGILLGNWGC